MTALRRLLRNKQLPATFLQTLTRHPDAEVRGAAKLHMAAPVAADQSAELDAALHALPTLLRLDLLPVWLLEPLGGAANNELRRGLNFSTHPDRIPTHHNLFKQSWCFSTAC